MYQDNYSRNILWQNLRSNLYFIKWLLSGIKGKDTYSKSETFKAIITDPKRDFEPIELKALML